MKRLNWLVIQKYNNYSPGRWLIQMDMYSENDKIMILETGEVLTVIADLSDRLDRGIIVRENIGRNLSTTEVRPAGRTRERAEAAIGVIPPDPPPPVPEHLLNY